MMEKISKIERKNFHLYGFFFSFLLIEKGKKEKHLFFFLGVFIYCSFTETFKCGSRLSDICFNYAPRW